MSAKEEEEKGTLLKVSDPWKVIKGIKIIIGVFFQRERKKGRKQ